MPKDLCAEKPGRGAKRAGGGLGGRPGLQLTPLLENFVPADKLVPEVGDLIEVNRLLYCHWVLYVGRRQVVHVTGPESDLCKTPEAQVRLCPLAEVAGTSPVRVNNKLVPARGRGVKPLSVDRVVSNALSLVGQDVPYDLLNRNCEHYMTEWKYGVAWSDQANTALTVMTMFQKGRKHDKRNVGHASGTRRSKATGNHGLTMLEGLASILQNVPKPSTSSQDLLTLPKS